MVRQWQEMFYEERYSEVYLSPDLPDYKMWAEAMGCVGMRVESPEEVLPAIEKANEIDDRPVVIDFRTDAREKVYPMVPSGQVQQRDRRRSGAGPRGSVTMAERPSTTSSPCSSRTSRACSPGWPGCSPAAGFNIVSLAVAPTDDERFSRITVVVDVESAPLEQVVKQLDKLVNVVKITELAPGDSVQRELLLATVSATPGDPGPDHRVGRRVRGSYSRRRPGRADHLPRWFAGEGERLRADDQALRHRGAAAHGAGRAAQARPTPAAAAARRRHRRPLDRCPRRRSVPIRRNAPTPTHPSTIRPERITNPGAGCGQRVLREGRRPIADRRPQGRHHRLRLAGPRPRAEPQGLGHRRGHRPARGLGLEGQGRERPACGC